MAIKGRAKRREEKVTEKPLDAEGSAEAALASVEGGEQEQKRGRGRPKKEVNWDLVGYFASMGSPREEIAQAVGVSLDTLMRGANGKIFEGILAGGIYKANASIRRVLFGTLRGRLIDPDGKVIEIPVDERIAMAKYLAQRKTYLNLAERVDVTTDDEQLGASSSKDVLVITVKNDKGAQGSTAPAKEQKPAKRRKPKRDEEDE